MNTLFLTDWTINLWLIDVVSAEVAVCSTFAVGTAVLATRRSEPLEVVVKKLPRCMWHMDS